MRAKDRKITRKNGLAMPKALDHRQAEAFAK